MNESTRELLWMNLLFDLLVLMLLWSPPGSPPRTTKMRSVPATSAGSWRRGSAWWSERRPGRGDPEVGHIDILQTC